ncbi:hypothetical protein [Methanothrix sp.]|uniref:hypothetical protein n=1 Tax=Methanothrix sp. TaxID=90426 RepID=UPI0032977972
MKMGEKSEFAAKSSIAALQEKAMDIIASRPEGIYQSDLRRLLEIDSSKCSKVVARLQGSELIRRESVPASSTYLLKLSGAFVPSPADGSSNATAPSAAPAYAGSREKKSGDEEKRKDAAGKLKGGISRIHAESDLERLIQGNADGRIKKLIDRQIDRLIDRRVFGQVNRRIQCSIGKIEDTINRKTDSSRDGKRSSPIESENDGPRDFNELDRPVGSYFDCSIEDNLGSKSEEDLDIDDRIDSYINHNRLPGSRSHIDSYLTEIYLLYLTRATSF